MSQDARNANQFSLLHQKINYIETNFRTMLNRLDELERRVLIIEYDMNRAIMGNLRGSKNGS